MIEKVSDYNFQILILKEKKIDLINWLRFKK
jgi:hypothetical protein